MNTALLHALMACDTDVNGAMRRFCEDETLYITCLGGFLDDPTLGELNQAMEKGDWDEAFTAAHALKGLASNMGFVPLFHATAELVVHIRTGRLGEVDASRLRVNQCYQALTAAIGAYCGAETRLEKMRENA